MADYRDTFTSEIYVNQSQAQDAVEKYTKKLADLNKQLAEIDKSEEGWEKKEKKLQKQIKSTEGSLKSVQTGVENYQKAMNSLDGRSLSNLIKLKKQLNAEIKKLVPGTQEYIRLTEDYKKVEARIKSIEKATKLMNEETRRSKSIVDSAVGFFNKYWSMFDTLTRTISGVSMKFRQCAEDAAKLDDVYSDVMKTTGLLHEEVEGLDKELMKINTRTSREQLLLLARDAGKLGIQGKEDILGFVRAADQIQVALGEDLGEGAIRNLGKIADVFGLTKEMGIEKSLLSIASAVNALGQASTASEAYLVDFTQRLAGVGAMAGLSVQDILGFASGLDQSAMKVEMAATAFQKFLMSMYEEPAKFAKYAGMEVEAFSELLKTNANEAITTVMKAMNGQDGFAAMVPMFNAIGLDGARAVGVLSAMTKNLDAVTEAQRLANVEFEKATSVTDEYTVKNNNLNAQLDKARKEFKNASIALGQSLNPILLKSTNITTYLIKALANYGKEIKAAVIAIAALTAVMKLNTIAHTVYQTVVKGLTAIQSTFTVVIKATSYAINALRGRTVAATKAYLAMKAAMSTSVFGVIAAAVAAATVAITHFVKKQREAADAAKYMASVEQKVTEAYADEEAKVKTLVSIVRDNNIAYDHRKKALDELQKIVPDYHASLSKEGKLIEGNTNVLDKYIEKLREATRWQVYQDEWQDLERQLVEVQDKIADARAKAQEELVRNGGNTTEKYTMEVDTWGGGTKVQETYTEYGKIMRTINTLQEKENKLLAEQEQIRGRMGKMNKQQERELSAEEKEIEEIRAKYQKLFDEVRNDMSITPAEGTKRMGAIQAQMNKEIEAVRKRYKAETTVVNEEEKVITDDKIDHYKEALQGLEVQQRQEENLLKEQYANNRLSAEQYEKEMREIKLRYLQQKVNLVKEYGKDETSAVAAWLDAQIAANQQANKEIDALLQQRSDWEKQQQEELEAYQKQIEALVAEGEKVKASLNPSVARTKEMQTELDKLEELHQAKILSEQEYEEAVKQLRKKYADEDLKEKLANVQKYVEQSNMLFSEASNFVTALKEAESAKLEAQYQADLTAAGDNAEKKASVEAEYEQKKLDLQKKYADVEMVVNIAKTIASGAVAAIRAYAEGGPYAGPILAALIAATTAAEVATIVAQRDAIKNTSVNTTASTDFSTDSTSAPTGKRTITGMAKGGFTAGHTTLTTIGEEGIEWVAPHWMVQENPVTFPNLERYRKTGSNGHSGSRQQGFAQGGYSDEPAAVANSAAMLAEIDWQAMREFNTILRYCAENGLFVKYGDILIADEKHHYFKNITAR